MRLDEDAMAGRRPVRGVWGVKVSLIMLCGQVVGGTRSGSLLQSGNAKLDTTNTSFGQHSILAFYYCMYALPVQNLHNGK